ncbi:MAG: M81 family metallopeptidase [Planctomycetaceae bacterium]|nr:M81 family metallopeptidase [Planctomycetaceae bacterium]
MPPSPRIFIAGLFHETHTFLDGTTGWEDFQILRGAEILAIKGESSPMGGALEVAEKLGWDVFPALSAAAYPSAIVQTAVFEKYWSEFSAALAKCLASGPLDGIFLVLHGAMACETIDDVEGVLLERLSQQLLNSGRALSPAIPVFGVYDLHANFTPKMAEHSHCLVAYRENPHADARESAVRAVHLLSRSLQSSALPRTILAQPPIVWPPTGTGTASNPMQGLLKTARQLQHDHPNFWEVNVTPGFAFADTFDTGLSFGIITTGNAEEANVALEQLSAQAWKLAAVGNVLEKSVDEVLPGLPRNESGLTVIAEPSDNIGGGAPGDCTGLLRAFINYGFTNTAVCLCDPDAVRELQKHALGTMVSIAIGGRGSRLDPGPLELTVKLIKICDGLFELRDRQSHLASMVGDRFNMGDCAVVEYAGITILLTSVKTPPMDLGQWLHVGFDPSNFSFVGVKAAVSHQRAWDPISKGNIWVSTPGPCSSDLRSLPYRKLRRPVFPLDDINTPD